MNPLAHYHLLVERLLAPDGDVAAAVTDFVTPLSPDDSDRIETHLEVAWDVVVTAAANAPDALQPRLVNLVTGVQRHELPGVRVWGQRVLTDLPLLGDRLSRAWDEPHDPAHWVRLNAFTARLAATTTVADFLPLGLRTIAAALEPPAGPRPPVAESHAPVAPAVEWFRHAGPQLLEASLHGRTYAGRLGDPTARAEGGFSVTRWAAWRGCLDTLARSGDRTAREGFKLLSRHDARIAEHYRR